MRAGRTLVVALGCAATAGLFLGSSTLAGADQKEEPLVELGRRLFFDTTASRTGTVSCSSCHDPEHGFADARQFSPDEHGPAPRHAQPITNLTSRAFHWDGEFSKLEDLVEARVAPTAQASKANRRRVAARHRVAGDRADEDLVRRRGINSMGGGYPGVAPQPTAVADATPLALRGGRHTPVASRLAEDGRYADAFERAFGSAQPTTDRVIDAMAAYMRTVRSTLAPYDGFAAGNTAAISASARRGHTLFTGKARCSTCHVLDTDTKDALQPRFRNTGVAKAQSLRTKDTTLRIPEGAKRVVKGLSVAMSAALGQNEDAGRAGATFFTADRRKFKVPNLRDVALRPPYMHDGSLATLADVVDYYNEGGTANDGLHDAIEPLGLTAMERLDLVEFLGSLTGHQRAGLGPVPRHRPLEHAFRIVDLFGKPVAGLSVTITPTGDRLRGSTAMPSPFARVTDDDGWVRFPFPKATHVSLSADGLEIGVGRTIPDSANELTFRATPDDMFTVRIRRRAFDPEFPAELSLAPLPTMKLVAVSGKEGLSRFEKNVSKSQTVTLERIATVGELEAIYAAPAPQDGKSALMNVMLGQAHGPFEVDLSGGASEPIDLGAPTPQQAIGLTIVGETGAVFGLPAGFVEVFDTLPEEARRKMAEHFEQLEENAQKLEERLQPDEPEAE